MDFVDGWISCKKPEDSNIGFSLSTAMFLNSAFTIARFCAMAKNVKVIAKIKSKNFLMFLYLRFMTSGKSQAIRTVTQV